METSVMTLNKIKSRLAQVPTEKLTEIYDFVEFILRKSRPKSQRRNIAKLEGIWKGQGFEKIDNLETEIRSIRQNSDQSMSERFNKWNI